MNDNPKPLPVDPEKNCSGGPSPEETISCMDNKDNEAIMAGTRSTREALNNLDYLSSYAQPLGPLSRALMNTAPARKLPQNKYIGFPPRAYIAMANAKKKP